jgi:hypothetical protein
VNDCVHPTDCVDLVGDIMRLFGTSEITDYHPGSAVCEIAHAGGPLGVARVKKDLMPVVEESQGRRPAQSLGRSGDEDACHAC